MIEPYLDETVVFDNYYKFSFTFKGLAKDGKIITISVGGTGDDIYRFDVDTNPVKVKTLVELWNVEFEQDKNGNLFGYSNV